MWSRLAICSECCVLYWLEFSYGSLAVGVPDGRGIMDDGGYKELVGGNYSLFALPPGCTGQGAKNVETGPGSVGRGGGMLRESEVGVEGDPQDFGLAAEGQGLSGQGNCRIHAGLVGVGGEESGVGLFY